MIKETVDMPWLDNPMFLKPTKRSFITADDYQSDKDCIEQERLKMT